eukprot:g25875.t1
MPPPLPASGCRTQACLIVMKITSTSSSRMTWAFDAPKTRLRFFFPSSQSESRTVFFGLFSAIRSTIPDLMLQFVLFVLLVSASHLNEHKALEECTTLQGRSIQLGVLYREALPSYSLTSLNSTFSEYLSSVLSKYGCTGGVNLVMLTAAQMDSEQELSGLDLLFIDPGSLENLLLLNPENLLLATISRSYTSGYATSNIAGALVCYSCLILSYGFNLMVHFGCDLK